MLFLAFDRLISDYTKIYSLVILCIHNLLQNIFDSNQTPGFWLKRLRNIIKISINTPKPQNQKMHASPTLKFLSMLQYSQSSEYVLIYFVSHKVGIKVLSRTFFQNRIIISGSWNMTLSLVSLCGVFPLGWKENKK